MMRPTGKLTGNRPEDALRQPAHVNLDNATVRRAAELVILSRERIDNVGPLSACQSPDFLILQVVGTISAVRTAKAFVARVAARPLNLVTGVRTTSSGLAWERSCARRSDDADAF
jgi:hypothetical protein